MSKREETMMKPMKGMGAMKPPADWPATVTLKCQKCGATQAAPNHCGKPMAIRKVDGKDMLTCWMGPGCGKAEVPKHHDLPMTVA